MHIFTEEKECKVKKTKDKGMASIKMSLWKGIPHPRFASCQACHLATLNWDFSLICSIELRLQSDFAGTSA